MDLTNGTGYVGSSVSPIAVGYSAVYNALLRGGFQFNENVIPKNVKIASAVLRSNITNNIFRAGGKVDARVGQLGSNGGVSTGGGNFTVNYGEPNHERDIDVTIPVRNIIEEKSLNKIIMIYGNATIVAGHNTSISINPIELIIEYETPPTKPKLLFPNGGEVLDGIHQVSWEPSTDAETPQDELQYQIQMQKNGGFWIDVSTLTNPGASTFAYDFSDETESSLVKMRVRAYDGYLYSDWDESDGAFAIQRNVAPTRPTNLRPSGNIVDRTKVTRLSWKHNDINTRDIQTKADLQWKVQGESSWNNLTTSGPDEEFYIYQDTFQLGQVEWRVRTYDRGGLVSPWSNVAVFTVDEPSNAPNIITPTDTVAVSRPLIQWGAIAQTSYQIIIEDLSNTVIWDTGEVISSSKSIECGVDLINGMNYRIKIRIKDGTEIFSPFSEQAFLVTYTPPALPIVEIDNTEVGARLTITNPEPTGTQPEVLYCDVYKLVDEDWIRIATQVVFMHEDYSASGKAELYRVRAFGDNGTYSQSEIVTNTFTLEHPVFSSTSDQDVYIFLNHMTATAVQKKRGRTLMNFAGRSRPLAEFGQQQAEFYDFEWVSLEREKVEAFYEFLDRRETLLYRDAEGRRDYISIEETNEVESIGGKILFTISFTGDVVWYKEEV